MPALVEPQRVRGRAIRELLEDMLDSVFQFGAVDLCREDVGIRFSEYAKMVVEGAVDDSHEGEEVSLVVAAVTDVDQSLHERAGARAWGTDDENGALSHDCDSI